jgi:hypothetical protein
MARTPFKSLFCERFGCSPAEYEKRAFRKCLFWHARFFAPLVRAIDREFFVEDFKFIRYLGDSIGRREANVELLDFNDSNRRHWRLLRTTLKIRVSGRKAIRLASQLFREAGQADAATAPPENSHPRPSI